MGETDPITDVSHRAYSCSAHEYAAMQMHAVFMCNTVISVSCQSSASFFLFMMSGEKKSREARGSCNGLLCECTFTFPPAFILLRTCLKARFEKPGEVQSVPLHFFFETTKISPKHIHIVMNSRKPA